MGAEGLDSGTLLPLRVVSLPLNGTFISPSEELTEVKSEDVDRVGRVGQELVSAEVPGHGSFRAKAAEAVVASV